ncbi:MAG: agmatine deiminase family protein [Myxococcales bacterium]|nr:agmatine deiminase family protein [Myxococcales bacterium]
MSVTIPAEWVAHRAMWVGYPSHAELWEDDLEAAQEEVAALVRALVDPGRERVRLLVYGDDAKRDAERRLGKLAGAEVDVVPARFGDIWLRDTGPLFTADGRAIAFRFNGWGGKYVLEHDTEVAGQLAAASGAELVQHEFILEGGALDHDGLGTVLTTRQCLLNENRNTGWDEAKAEAALTESIGAKAVRWLGDGLLNDHTDGHVDNLARFVARGVVACPAAQGADDPNAAVYAATRETLAKMDDAAGQRLAVVGVPSPGRVVVDGRIVPASHMNFLIANGAVIVPEYNDHVGAAVEALRPHFPGRAVVASSSRAVLQGGGSFHCITQQEPEGP